jgi:ABC-type transport system involved in multi-copper enzyme maturation permease subunit
MNKVFAIARVGIQELYRRKDFYVLFVLTAVITLLLGGVNFFNEDHIVRYVKEICLALIWIATLVIAIVTAARQIPSEIESKTLFPLLAKPVSRSQVILGKFLGCWLACGIALLVFYLFFAVLSASREHTLPVTSYLQTIWMHWIFLALVVALSLLGSLVFAAPSSTICIVLLVVLGILLVGEHLHKVAIQSPGIGGVLLTAIYYALPHLEFYDLRLVAIHNWPAREWWAILVATLYGGVYGAIVLLGACVLFNRRILTR